MGKGIKTRVAEKGIKAIDKAAVASERMKEAYIRTRDKADHSLYAAESSPGEYASDRLSSGVDNVAHEAIHQFDKQGRKGIKTTKENISKVKENIQKRKAAAAQPKKQAEKQAARKTRQAADRISEPVRTLRQERGAVKTLDRGKKSIKTVDRGRKTIKQASSTAKGTVKTASKSIKTAEKTAKASIKTTQQAAKAAQRTAQATARAARAAAHAARAAARAAVVAAKVAAKATIAAVKAIIAATKALIAAIAAGGWIAVLVIVIICLIGLLIGSCFGIFFSGEDSGSGYTMQNVVQEINDDYQQQIDTTKANLSHDVLEMSGSRAVWPEVLAVYAVKTTTDPQEVATIDDSKKAILTDIFWEMNQISSRTETRTETVITETDDGHGNIVETESTVTQTYLYITVSHKTAEEMAEQYGFDKEQKEQLAELLAEENRSLWSAVLYGIYTEDGAIVSVALSQVGNVGGEPYWSWYGFSGRVEWCACFVSWCANECGYIDTGVIPQYAGCVNGVQWFKDRGQWMDGSAEPAPGMIIFFDGDDENGQDVLSDHTGIVEKVENGRVYTIEGNSGDSVRQNSYPVGHYEVLGYGCPDF